MKLSKHISGGSLA